MESTTNKETFLKILLVEDNPGDVYIIKEHLKSAGSKFSLTHTSQLSEAIRLFEVQLFDVILLDLGLPDSIGLDTLRKIQVSEVKVPVVVMTGLDDEEVALASLKEGAQDYLVKNNLTPQNILRAIKYGIERKNNQEILKKHTRQFSILSSARASINECEDVLSIYKTICESITMLLDNVTILPIDFIDQRITDSICHEWIELHFNQIRNIYGLTLEQSLAGILKESIELYADGKPHSLNSEIIETFSIKYGAELLTEFKAVLTANEVFTIGFSRNQQYYGGLIIFSKKPIEANDMDIIEAISSQASLNIHRRYVENDLKLSENRYRLLFTEVKNAKEALQALNEELELKIQIRTKELAETNTLLKSELEERKRFEGKLKKYTSELKDLNATKDKFFGIIAHDLRNPFSSLLGASELLMNSIDKFDINNIKNISTLLNDSAKRGYALLENLLEWSRAQTGNIKYNPRKLDISKLIADNICNMELYVVNKKIKITSEVQEEIQTMVDKDMFNTILRNLLNNAVKFTHKGGKVSVICNKCDDHIIVIVKDTGIGIPQKDIDKLFRIDTQYTNIGTAQERGTGLGLLLCKEFVEKHGGKIWVESYVGKGSEFKFTIPGTIKPLRKADAEIKISSLTETKIS